MRRLPSRSRAQREGRVSLDRAGMATRAFWRRERACRVGLASACAGALASLLSSSSRQCREGKGCRSGQADSWLPLRDR